MRRGFVISLPERNVRSVAAAVGGALRETAALALPRLVRALDALECGTGRVPRR